MTLNDELATWVNSRPDWQKSAMAKFCQGGSLTDADIRDIVDQLIEGTVPPAPDLRSSDIPGSTDDEHSVALTDLSEIEGVNALVSGQSLTFSANGATIIFGNNGTGKSGYARLIREAVSARFKAGALLSDVFSEPAVQQAATITFTVNGCENAWKLGEPGSPLLSRMRFFDEDCGEAYVTKAAEVDYQPSGLSLLDQLSDACERVSAEITRRLAANEAARPKFPSLSADTSASRFVEGLGPDTTSEEIDTAVTLAADHDTQLATAINKEARLKGSDPAKEKKRLEGLSAAWATVGARAKRLQHALSADELDTLTALADSAAQLREAARIASSQSFDSEPLTSIGSTGWRALWEAAREYSRSEVYHDHDFPYTDDSAVCVLCQQTLSSEASNRLHRFEKFVSDKTSRYADTAANKVADKVKEYRDLGAQPQDVTTALVRLAEAEEDVANVSAWLECSTARATKTSEWLLNGASKHDSPEPAEALAVDTINERSRDLKSEADDIDQVEFTSLLTEASKLKHELQDAKQLAEARDLVAHEVQRLAERRVLDGLRSQCSTNGITTKRGDLTERFVTEAVKDRFVRETERLGLSRVTLNRTGRGRQAALHHQPGLVGSTQSVPVDRVLSEGEQTALGLAGFLTEVELDDSYSGVIFDDPISSLDSERRSRVAKRLIELAASRQIIIFTHEITFVHALMKAAQQQSIEITCRSVQRKGGAKPGHVLNELPWTAKDIKQRINQLESRIAQLRREQDDLIDDDYSDRIAKLAGNLSESLERAVNLHIVNELVDRGTNEVRPVMLKILPKFEVQDHDEFQDLYRLTSSWAARHDNAPEENYVPPTIDEFAGAVSRFKIWHDRVRKFAN
ncbi:AAA family ATPase [Dermabacter vaginalis]|uniref:AAA family ATPase n=1 Tax=Dermabacter vaginalis TaxID=1630135 RepID=UPI001EF57536|nr:AAA family ATPase [Dermabacter vaginalis]MCG7442798.1 AAA family ATPase [Dermabacter vaginalis]